MSQGSLKTSCQSRSYTPRLIMVTTVEVGKEEIQAFLEGQLEEMQNKLWYLGDLSAELSTEALRYMARH